MAGKGGGGWAKQERETGDLLREAAKEVDRNAAAIEELAKSDAETEIDGVDDRLDQLRARVAGLVKSGVVTEPLAEIRASGSQVEEPAAVPTVGRPIRDDVALSGELPLELILAIEKDAGRLPPVAAPMDAWDIGIVVGAGLVGALLDFFVVRIPRESPPTEALRMIPGKDIEGWLGDRVKAAFDRVSPNTYMGAKLDGFTPKSHRMLTFGHDPLLGMVFGLLDIRHGTMTGIDTAGELFIRPIERAPQSSFALTPLIWIGHLLSDVATSMGLPIPGFGLSQLLQFGSFGERQENLAQLALRMYREGYDLRHYLAMGLSVGAVELIVRAYCFFRYSVGDHGPAPEVLTASTYDEYESEWWAQTLRLEIKRQAAETRELRLLALAHTLATGANALKAQFAAGGNPLAINLAQWQRWLWSLGRLSGNWLGRCEGRELERMQRNRELIDQGWQDLLASLPTPGGMSRLGPGDGEGYRRIRQLTRAPADAFEI